LKEVFAKKQSIELDMTGMLAEFAEGLRKTCVAMLLQTYCQLQEVTQRNGGHIKAHTDKETLHRCWAICMKFVVYEWPIHFL